MHSTGSSASTNLVWKQWNIGLGGAYILNHSKTSPEESLSSWNLVQSNMNIEYVVQTLNFSVQFFSRYTGETKGFLSSGSFYTISPYYLSDLSFIKTLYNKHLKIQLGCKNLFNVTTLTASGTTSGGIHGGGNSGVNIAPGRNIFINLTLTL
jgi:outer membrane receptor for ferrienterochelin and colicins